MPLVGFKHKPQLPLDNIKLVFIKPTKLLCVLVNSTQRIRLKHHLNIMQNYKIYTDYILQSTCHEPTEDAPIVEPLLRALL